MNMELIGIEVLDGENKVTLYTESGGRITFEPGRTVLFHGGSIELHRLKIELAREIAANRTLQLKANPSAGVLEIVSSLPGRQMSNFVAGTLPEVTDEFFDALGKANERLAQWTR